MTELAAAACPDVPGSQARRLDRCSWLWCSFRAKSHSGAGGLKTRQKVIGYGNYFRLPAPVACRARLSYLTFRYSASAVERVRNVCNSRNALKGEGVRRARGPGVESPIVESAAGLGWVLRTLQLAKATHYPSRVLPELRTSFPTRSVHDPRTHQLGSHPHLSLNRLNRLKRLRRLSVHGILILSLQP